MPDGLTVDSEGNLWVAHWGGARVTKFLSSGVRVQAYQVSAPHVTTVGFGGEDLSTLYITTARDGMSPDALALWPQSGDLFSLKSVGRGVAEPLFAMK